ncbi:MAG TPA: HAMP domain-containing sensor histidine kinase [Longimicrobiales bacterium]
MSGPASHDNRDLVDEDSVSTDGTDPFARIRSPTLRAAARRAAAISRHERADALDDDELIAHLIAITRAVETETAPPDLLPDSMPVAVLCRRLLDLLRSEVINGWTTSAPEGAEMLRVLRAIEAVRAVLEPRWDQHFARHLAAPTGLDLVVEVAHDLRSPLTSILFLSETLRKGHSGEVNDVQRRQLGIIYSAALGLISVASDMVELARGGDQLVDPTPSPFSITETFQSVRDIVQPLAEEKGLSIRLAPPASDQRLGYPVALSRVLLNLTTNALKFTDEGGVELSARAKGLSRLEFSVRDTGRGIDPEVQSTLYEPFRRAPSRKSYYFSGTGLGLTICRKLVEAMGSKLELESQRDCGTRFFFELDLPPASPL